MLSKPLLRWTVLGGVALTIGLGACFGVLWLDDLRTRRPVFPPVIGTLRSATEPIIGGIDSADLPKKVRAFQGHRDGVTQVVFSSDGKHLASASMDGTVRVWDVTSGKELRRLSHGGAVYSVAFSPDDRRLLSGDANHTVYLWDWESGELLALLERHMGAVRSVAFLPDGKRALVGSYRSVKLWDLEQEKVLAVFPTDEVQASHLAVSRDGHRFLCAGDGSPRVIWLWDIETQQEVRRFAVEGEHVVGLTFSDDESHVWCRSFWGRIQVWETETGKPVRNDESSRAAESCVWRRGERLCLAGSSPATVSVEDGRHPMPFDYSLRGTATWATAVALSPDGKYAIAGSSGRWDTNSIWHIPLKRDLQLWDIQGIARLAEESRRTPTSSPATVLRQPQ